MEELLTSKEVQRILKISRTTLYRLEKKGLLKPRRLPGGRKKLYTKEDILKLLKQAGNQQ